MPSLDSPPSSLSLLRRLRSKTSALSLRTPRRQVTDFHIELQDPHRVYSNRDLVPGSVCITVERPLAITHLTVSLVGRVDVDVYASSTREPGAVSRKKRRKVEDWGSYGGDSSAFNICRDELVLCGEGRLEPGVYKFGFELEFCKLPGVEGLPTSLDFEKGSISYEISATLTRPHSSTPTTTCSAKISMMDEIDVSHYPRPKPRIIRLDPVSRSHRSSKKKEKEYPRSISPATTNTSSTPSSSLGNLHETLDSKPARDMITASVELLHGGALRGETIGVKISIQHYKRVKSLNGIILTLMRQTRFDTDDNGSDDISLDKLKSGIGVPSSTFRKDLAQTICPLIIDPETLTAVVRANLRVPEDVFPTITNVPGGAVEFRYWIEVLMDLGGKLNGREDQFQDREAADGSSGGSGSGGGAGVRAVEGGVMIETEHLRRREKSVVCCKFEVIVGSVDSVGRKGRMPPPPPPPQPQPQPQPQQPQQLAPVYQPAWHRPPHHPQSLENEKARIRMAEEQLLPSSPMLGEPGPSSQPSAPVLGQELEEEDEEQEEEEVDKAERERLRLLQRESLPPGMEDAGEGSSRPSAPNLELETVEGAEGGLPVYYR